MTKKDKVEQKMKIREQNETFRRLLEEAMNRLNDTIYLCDAELADRIHEALTRKP